MDNRESTLSRTRLAQTDIHEQWENDYLNPQINRFYDEAFDRIIAQFGDTRGKTVLDIGCGYCFHTRRLARSELSITAVDFSEAALTEARKTVDQAGIGDRVTLQQADARALPFPDGHFDNVLIWGVLMHIPDVEQALREAVRVLKPGGKLALSENNRISFEAALVEPLINTVKRLTGRKAHKRNRAKLGIEEWHEAEHGSLVVRKTDMPALVEFCATLGMTLDTRFAGQFTELYARVPTRFLKRMIHGFNLAYFRSGGPAGLSLGNVLVFTKSGKS